MHFKLCAQVNLVPNGNFETYINCPTNSAQISEATPWFSCNPGTPDYYNICNFNDLVIGIPSNAMGYQQASSGGAYVGIYSYFDPITYGSQANGREYLSVQISTPLQANTTYYISCKVSLSDSSKYGIGDLGFYLSNNQISSSNVNALSFQPAVKSSIVLMDKNNWELIEGYYTSIGGENYLTFGNFYNSSNTNVINTGSGPYPCAYYYIDDVSVIDSAAIGIKKINNNPNINIYPNPSNGNIKIDLSKLNEGGDLQFVVYNSLGIEIKKLQITANEITNIDLSDLANGTYLYKVFKDGKLYKYDKLVLIK